MIIENPDALYVWLISCLGQLCDAEPAALAKYVMALIKKDKPHCELKDFCSDQLDVFLQKETKPFVEILFTTLENKSYMQSNPTLQSSTDAGATAEATYPLNGSTIIGSESLLHSTNIDLDLKRSKLFPFTSHSPSGSANSSPSCQSREIESKYPHAGKYQVFSPVLYDNQSPVGAVMTSINEHSIRTHDEDRSMMQERNQTAWESVDYPPLPNSEDLGQLIEKCSRLEHSDKDYRKHAIHKPLIPASPEKKRKLVKRTRIRCTDYDEKGYCMQGDLCLFDHGNDPLVVDNVSALQLGATSSQVSSPNSSYNRDSVVLQNPEDKECPPLPTSPPPPPPPLPADPPIAPAFIEPYNPESPIMYHKQPPKRNLSAPPNDDEPSGSGHCQTTRDTPTYEGMKPVAAYHTSAKRPRTRELVGVPTLEMNSREKSFDFTRLGPRKVTGMRTGEKCTLLIQKVPRNLNSIASLARHFSKFGTIISVQVCYNNDPEAALVQFSNHAEAMAAYRNSEPVLYNRFIRVSWHTPDNETCDSSNSFSNNEYKTNVWESAHPSDYISPNASSAGDGKSNASCSSNVLEKADLDRHSFVYKRSTAPRVIYDPAALRKSNVPQLTPKVKCYRDEKHKEILCKKMDLQKKIMSLIQSHIESEKLLVAKLEKLKKRELLDLLNSENIPTKDATLKKEEDLKKEEMLKKQENQKEEIKQMINVVRQKVLELNAQLKKESEEISNMTKIQIHRFSCRNEAEKELLDAELDLYNKQHRGDDISELKKKVEDLKQKGRKASSWTRSIDHRPKKPKVTSSTVIAKKENLENKFSVFASGSKFGEDSLPPDPSSAVYPYSENAEHFDSSKAYCSPHPNSDKQSSGLNKCATNSGDTECSSAPASVECAPDTIGVECASELAGAVCDPIDMECTSEPIIQIGSGADIVVDPEEILKIDDDEEDDDDREISEARFRNGHGK